MIDPMSPLSPQGQARQRAILDTALRAAAARRRRRLALRTAPVLSIAVIAAGLIFGVWRRPPAPPLVHAPPAPYRPAPPGPSLPPSREVIVQWIATDHNLVDQLAVRPPATDVPRLTDDQLVTQLADSGRAAGILRIHGRTLTIPQDLPPGGRPDKR